MNFVKEFGKIKLYSQSNVDLVSIDLVKKNNGIDSITNSMSVIELENLRGMCNVPNPAHEGPAVRGMKH